MPMVRVVDGAGLALESLPRDPRLDFFRGLGMFIILAGHVHMNPWANWMPGRFGFSDAAEIFVFCSGLAAARAFGGTFEHFGFQAGVARTAQRCWRLYWVHVGVFAATAGVVVAADRFLPGAHYVDALSLSPFFADPAAGLFGLLTLSYVPFFFDILPMYLVLIALMPVVIGIAWLAGPLAGMAFSIGLWLVGMTGTIDLPADPWSERGWFFNPFCWQVVFFTAYAFGRGWLAVPDVTRPRVMFAAGVVALSVPVSWKPLVDTLPGMLTLHDLIYTPAFKTEFHPLRAVHFLSVAWLARAAAGPRGCRLRGAVVQVMSRVGRQTLPVFLFSLPFAWVLAVLLDVFGRSGLATLAVNVLGCAGLIVVADIVAWYRHPPWTTRKGRPAMDPAHHAPLPAE